MTTSYVGWRSTNPEVLLSISPCAILDVWVMRKESGDGQAPSTMWRFRPIDHYPDCELELVTINAVLSSIHHTCLGPEASRAKDGRQEMWMPSVQPFSYPDKA